MADEQYRGYAEISPAEIEEYVRGVDFPADKKQIVATVVDDGAPTKVLTLFNTLPEQDYEDAFEVTEALGTGGLYEQNPEEERNAVEEEQRERIPDRERKVD